jgi:hypothetical protein
LRSLAERLKFSVSTTDKKSSTHLISMFFALLSEAVSDAVHGVVY